MSKWISVKDKLPDDELHDVLVYCEYRAAKECDVGYLDCSGDWFDEKYDEYIPVTHWMPLPKSPK